MNRRLRETAVRTLDSFVASVFGIVEMTACASCESVNRLGFGGAGHAVPLGTWLHAIVTARATAAMRKRRPGQKPGPSSLDPTIGRESVPNADSCRSRSAPT